MDVAEIPIYLSATLIGLGRKPYVLLLMGWYRTPSELDVTGAFKLFGSGADLARWAGDPAAAFDALLNQCGQTVAVGDEVGLLVRHHVLTTTQEAEQSGDPQEFVRVVDASGVEAGEVGAFVRVRPDRQKTDVVWAFALNYAAYRDWVRSEAS